VAAAGFEFVWIFMLFLALIFAVGDTPYVNTPEKTRVLNIFSAGPAAAGVLFGLVAILFRLPVKAVDWFFLIAGILVCSSLVYLLVKGIW
jgi:hypothetical protein